MLIVDIIMYVIIWLLRGSKRVLGQVWASAHFEAFTRTYPQWSCIPHHHRSHYRGYHKEKREFKEKGNLVDDVYVNFARKDYFRLNGFKLYYDAGFDDLLWTYGFLMFFWKSYYKVKKAIPLKIRRSIVDYIRDQIFIMFLPMRYWYHAHLVLKMYGPFHWWHKMWRYCWRWILWGFISIVSNIRVVFLIPVRRRELDKWERRVLLYSDKKYRKCIWYYLVEVEKQRIKIQVYRWFIFLFKSTAFLLRLNVFLVIFLIDGILRRMLWAYSFFYTIVFTFTWKIWDFIFFNESWEKFVECTTLRIYDIVSYYIWSYLADFVHYDYKKEKSRE